MPRIQLSRQSRLLPLSVFIKCLLGALYMFAQGAGWEGLRRQTRLAHVQLSLPRHVTLGEWLPISVSSVS